MNFTLDDSDPSLSFSATGWAIQNPSDPDLDQFFDNTYHVAQQDGATVTFVFQGVAFAIYGSTGPGHAKFTVQYDNVVVNNLAASASQTRFRQKLFGHSFGSDAGSHTVKLTAVLSGEGLAGEWLDLDYITFTSSSNASTSSGLPTATAVPPWLSGHSSSSRVPTVLAALFGSVIGIAALLLVLYCVLRRIYDRRRARERAFRYGQSSANPSVSLAGTYAPSSGGSAKGSGFGAGAILDMVGIGGGGGGGGGGAGSGGAGSGGGGARDGSQRSAPYSHTHAHTGSNGGSLASHAVEMRSFSTDVHRDPDRDRGGASASPIAWTRQKVGGGHKGDADSLRTDFLQV
ncbi:hypothetical protein C8Q70DRAFT_1046347 [Cubamyces menziesii]|nr:hypothetical protein C8Q70DRAFT_1046347 [Cubamyces menziesii]